MLTSANKCCAPGRAALIAGAVFVAAPAFAADIAQEWDQAKAPPAPKLWDVTVKAATTAFLVLDMEERTCNDKDRPRCPQAVPATAGFLKKAREKHLKDNKIETVIVCGTSAYGAVLFTATGASLRGFKVILPVDCMPGSSQHEEQAAVFTVLNGPG